MSDKIKINKISKRVLTQKGFDKTGCFGCSCHDSCCQYGCDFDAQSHDLVFQNREIIEPLLGIKLEKCFGHHWIDDPEYLGGKYIRSKKGTTGFCIFHRQTGKGCHLYSLVISGAVGNPRLIPSICRLFPLTWAFGSLINYDEQKGSIIPLDCNCVDPLNSTTKNILETQASAVEDIFEVEE